MTDLPKSIPVFPLLGALLLPGGLLPLNIFEPRYVAMVEDAMAGSRMIGMIQPRPEKMPCGTPYIRDIGCAGKITECEATRDGRYLIMLSGVSRFKVADEMTPLRGYRRIRTEWLPEAEAAPLQLDRQRLLPALKHYLSGRGMNCDFGAAASCPDEKLLTTLAMICPFTPAEQQALLEAPNALARGELLVSLLEIACPDCAKQH